MPQFKYLARNLQGSTARGQFEAKDRSAAIELLRKEQLLILSLEEVQTQFFLLKYLPFLRKIKMEDLVVFSRQLATVVEAGVPLVNALDIIADQMEKPDLRSRIGKIRDDVEAGSSFSEAISKDREFFSAFFINMVKAGESSGTLDEILNRLADYIEKTNKLQKKVKSALIYPAVVTGMAVAVTVILMVKVIPIFKTIYSGFGAKLPDATQALLDASDFLKGNFILISIGVMSVVGLLIWFINTPKGRLFFDAFQLRMPIFGIILRKVAISKFTRTFSTLVRSGVPIMTALEIVGKTSGNVIIENAVEGVKKNVREGENISGPLGKTKIFPPLVVRMIHIGEKTGELEKMLTKISDFYDSEVDAAVSGLSSLIEPLIIAFLGIVVGGIVICMFLPILQISSIVKF